MTEPSPPEPGPSLARGPFGPLWYNRTEDPAEFNRIITISDGVFAIALTLLVVTIDIPVDIPDAELPAQLRVLWPQVFSFFLSFAIISQYWVAHHRLFGLLDAVDRRFMSLNLVYLAFIAFLPFPTELLGEFGDSPVSVIGYALCGGTVSGLETVLIGVAVRGGLLRPALSPSLYRYWLSQSLTPVVIFALSIPVALWNPYLGIASWIVLARPLNALLARFIPMGHRKA